MEQSSNLTTFITPFGRIHYNRLHFGITFAPEHFQQRMSELLQGIVGVVVQVDDTQDKGRARPPPYSSSRSTRESRG